MNWLRSKRIRQAFRFGWRDSRLIAKETGQNRLSCCWSFFSCFWKYYVFSNQYVNNKLYLLSKEERKTVAEEIGKRNRNHDDWVLDSYENAKFIRKWSSKKWNTTPSRVVRRQRAYSKRFNAGSGLIVQHNVNLHQEHFRWGSITIGNDVLLAKNVFIDYTGDVIIKDRVQLTDGAVVETHHHAFHSDLSMSREVLIPSKLVVEEGALIGARSIVLSSCHYIGKNARVGAGAVVTKDIPDYAVAVGAPAKVVKYLNKD